MINSAQLLTPTEVAEELRLDLLTIYKYIRNKKLLAIKFGRTYRITKEDLDKFIKANKTF
jgi:excisionase family DNA binding protein